MDELLLTVEMTQNYEALQNFLNKTTVQRGHSRPSGRHRQARKIRRLEAQNFKCVCGYTFHPNSHGKYRTATFEHVIPFRYGSSVFMNGDYVCEPCNQKYDNYCHEQKIQHIKNYFGSIDEPLM